MLVKEYKCPEFHIGFLGSKVQHNDYSLVNEDWRVRIVDRALALHTATMGLISLISYDLLNPLRVITECRARKKP